MRSNISFEVTASERARLEALVCDGKGSLPSSRASGISGYRIRRGADILRLCTQLGDSQIGFDVIQSL
jgi:hypothetical protein